MLHTRFAIQAADIPATGARPHDENGWPGAYWYGPAFTPAGSSTWTTAEDLMIFARAALDGTLPGSAALDPITEIPGGAIGLAWHRGEIGGRQITWHNGATGGSSAVLGLDRDRRQAVVILGNSMRDTDSTGLRLAATAPGEPIQAVERPKINIVLVLAWSVLGLTLVAGLATAAFRPRHRLAVISATVSATAGLLIMLAHGPWMLLPAWLWGGLTGTTLVLGVVAARRIAALPPLPDRRRWRAWLSLGSALLVLAFAVWAL